MVDLAASAGLVLDGWQRADMEAACAEGPDLRWAAFEVALLNQRQNGKGSEMEARQLAGLFLFGERLQTHTAHRVDTCLEHFRRVKHLVTETPDLSRRLRKITETNGAEAIELMSGERLIFKARSKGSGRGFSGTTVYLDEAFYLFLGMVSGMIPTMSAQRNPQLWYASSAPLDKPESAVLRNLCKRGRAGGSPSLCFIEYSAAPDCASDDPEAIAAANPALGTRITLEFCAHEREAMTDEEFRRERLGIWVDPEDVVEDARVIPAGSWSLCEDQDSRIVGQVRLALDVSVDQRHAAFVAAGATADGQPHVEITGHGGLVDYRSGTGWVIPRAKELQQRWGGPLVLAAKSPAAVLLYEDLTLAGVEVVLATVEEHASAAAGFLRSVLDGTLRHLGQGPLDTAVAGAAQRNYGDSWLWSRRNSSVDICPLVAATLAAWAAAAAPKESDFFLI